MDSRLGAGHLSSPPRFISSPAPVVRPRSRSVDCINSVRLVDLLITYCIFHYISIYHETSAIYIYIYIIHILYIYSDDSQTSIGYHSMCYFALQERLSGGAGDEPVLEPDQGGQLVRAASMIMIDQVP